MYAKVWGRSELRMGNLDRGLIFVDCIVRERDAASVIAALKPHVHAGIVALHDSKFQGRERHGRHPKGGTRVKNATRRV